MAIVLASQSPRRKELLRLLCSDFKIITADIDETVLKGETAAHTVERLSRLKALAVKEKCGKDDVIISADTVVSINDKIIGKPAHRNQAIEYLCALSGKAHQVYSGVTVLRGDKIITRSVKTDVSFRPLDIKEIEAYADSGESYDKAGGYGIQGTAAAFVQSISGDYFNVVGLPVCELCGMLREMNVKILGI